MKCNRCREHKSISGSSDRWGENICDDCFTDTENKINDEFVQVIKFMRATHSREIGELKREYQQQTISKNAKLKLKEVCKKTQELGGDPDLIDDIQVLAHNFWDECCWTEVD